MGNVIATFAGCYDGHQGTTLSNRRRHWQRNTIQIRSWSNTIREFKNLPRNVWSVPIFAYIKGSNERSGRQEKIFDLLKLEFNMTPRNFTLPFPEARGSGKSFLINAFRGFKNVDPGATSTDVDDTTISVTRYPDPNKELLDSRLMFLELVP